MIIMSTQLLHLKSDENHHDASSASPAVIMTIMSTHLLHLQRCLTRHLKRIEEKDDEDNRDEDDFVDENKSKNRTDDDLRIMIDDKSDDDLHIMMMMIRVMMTFMRIEPIITMHPHHQQSS